MIYVTHDQIEAMTLADRIAIMKDGGIMQLGTPREIHNRPRNLHVADFIGSPLMNFIPGELADGEFRSDALVMPVEDYEFVDGPPASRDAVIGIRPEHIATGDALASAAARTGVKVEFVEPTGADTLVYAPLGAAGIHARVDGRSEIRPGDEIEIGFPPARISLFDPHTGARL